ncbi:ATPase AAA [Clostridia bacterium]|nr:ATPase AAA [Clostridia bacterium]
MKNPFTPTYGSVPPLFAGRREIIRQIIFGIENGPGDPNRSTVITGARGTGKTALLHQIAVEALEYGFISVYANSNSVLLDEILRRLEKEASEFIERENKAKISEVNISGFGIKIEYSDQKKSWEENLENIIEQLTAMNIGVLFEIDEVRGGDEQIRRFASLFQTFITARKNVCLIMAGLPHNIDNLFKDKVISFIRRSRKQELGLIDMSEVFYTLRETIETEGKTIDADALKIMTEETAGFPYLIQLIGYEVWQVSGDKKNIRRKDAEDGIRNAQRYIVSSVIELTLNDLSDKDREFLVAVSQLDTPADMSLIAQKLNVDSRYISQYRLRLIKEGVITSVKRGFVDFVLPQFRKYLRELSE